MLPLQDADDDDDIDAWNNELGAATKDGVNEALLSKYDDVEDLAFQKKRANRIQIGGKHTKTGAGNESRAKAQEDKSSFDFTKKQVGSDYYATNDEDPLLKGSGSFKKKKGQAGSKRQRVNPMALIDNDEEDIITALEGNISNQDQNPHLATKKARHDALDVQADQQVEQDIKKRANFQRAFDRV